MRVRSLSVAIACGILGALLASPPAWSAEQKPEQKITESNWEQHPRILEIRKLYNDIQSKLENKKLKYQEKNFAKLPRSCRGMYPLEYIGVATDHAGRVRMHVVAQRISHDDLLTTRNYYDEGGHLRFVYITNESPGFATIHNRIYLTDQGNVLWNVESEAKKLTFGHITRDSYEIRSLTTDGLLDEYRHKEVKCEPEEDAKQSGKARQAE